MRLDKYLKVARIIKRRTVANEACNIGRVTINGKSSKPSKDVRTGDIVSIKFGNRIFTFRVLEVPAGNLTKDKASSLYEIIGEENED